LSSGREKRSSGKSCGQNGSPDYQRGGKMNRNMIQQLQARLAKAQADLANLTLEAASGGGAVTVTVDGQQNVKSIKISREVVNPEDVEMLEDLVLTAVKEAITKSQEAAAKQLGGLTGGFKIPGLM
jgi:DNA-binding YbaB/EbfC family protein